MKVLGAIASLLPGLAGLKGALIAGSFCLAVGIAGGWKARALLADSERAERLAIYGAGLALTNAANEAQRRIELADRDRALAAAEAAASEERHRRDALENTLEELRHAPAEDDRPLSPTAQRFFDGLRAP